MNQKTHSVMFNAVKYSIDQNMNLVVLADIRKLRSYLKKNGYIKLTPTIILDLITEFVEDFTDSLINYDNDNPDTDFVKVLTVIPSITYLLRMILVLHVGLNLSFLPENSSFNIRLSTFIDSYIFRDKKRNFTPRDVLQDWNTFVLYTIPFDNRFNFFKSLFNIQNIGVKYLHNVYVINTKVRSFFILNSAPGLSFSDSQNDYLISELLEVIVGSSFYYVSKIAEYKKLLQYCVLLTRDTVTLLVDTVEEGVIPRTEVKIYSKICNVIEKYFINSILRQVTTNILNVATNRLTLKDMFTDEHIEDNTVYDLKNWFEKEMLDLSMSIPDYVVDDYEKTNSVYAYNSACFSLLRIYFEKYPLNEGHIWDIKLGNPNIGSILKYISNNYESSRFMITDPVEVLNMAKDKGMFTHNIGNFTYVTMSKNERIFMGIINNVDIDFLKKIERVFHEYIINMTASELYTETYYYTMDSSKNQTEESITFNNLLSLRYIHSMLVTLIFKKENSHVHC